MHPEIDRYADLQSPLHRWDPGLKIIGLGALAFTFALLQGPWLCGLALTTAILLLAIARIPIAFVVSRLRWVVLFMLPLFVLLPLGRADGVSWRQAEVQATVIVLRGLAVTLLLFPMWGTAPFHRSLQALGEYHVPRQLLQLFLFSYRYLFVYLDQLRRLRGALRARHFRPGMNRHTLRTFGYGVGMLIVTSFEQTQRILLAMRARGYRGQMQTLEATKRRSADWLKLLGAATLCVAFMIGDHLWMP
ncbi:MAG: energy-coupling factor transporter transmembrane component T [Planctomycetota bacterium]